MLRALGFYALVAVGVPLSLFQPFSGLLLYLFFAHAHPADFVWPGYVFNYGLLLVPALMAGYALFELRKSPPRLRGMLLLLAFWAWLAMAAVLAHNTEPAFAMLSRFSKMFVISFLIAAMANSEDRIRKVLTVLAGCLGFLGVKSLVGVILTGGQYRIQGPGGLMAEENEYALGMNMAIPLLYWLGSLEQRRWLKRLYQFAAFACAVTVIFTRSRSGFLGLMMVCLLIAMHSRRKLLAPFGLAIAATLFLALAPEAAMDRYKSIPTATQTDASAIGRIQAWETAVEMAKAHPIFGVGLRNFELTFLDYSSYEPRAPHNAFMALMAEAGIPSCLLFAALVLSASGACWSNWRRLHHSRRHHHLATYCLIVHATLLVYLVPNFFINRQDFDLMYHLVGLSAAMTAVVRQTLKAERATLIPPDFDLASARVAMQ
jgi:probable O-glycosylation ligase (exosortase A-associated)